MAISRMLIAAALFATSTPAWSQHEGHGGNAMQVVPSGTNPYVRGLYLLHNFEYSTAAAAFRDAQKADPANVMAFWGEAMTYNHPLWAEQDPAAARAVLARLGADPATRRSRARSAREAAWLEAVEALYGSGSKVERDFAYHARMEALFEADPSDIDARTFYALATLGLASQGRDTALYMKSAALLEEALPAHPDHPGLLHYMIHSYDDPVHAPLGERAAARYAKVAPDAGHAQHMISHIFLALGRWDEVERANVTASKLVNAQRAANGMPPTSCGHYNEWLAYSLDQQGENSQSLVDACGTQAIAAAAKGEDNSALGAVRNPFNNWADIAVRHGVDTGQWPTSDLGVVRDRALMGRFTLAYGKVLASRTDAAAVRAAVDQMKDYRAQIAAAMPTERPDDHESAAWLDRALAQSEAVMALASGDEERGIELLRAAAKAEAALPVPFGPPVLAKPSAELLGDELFASGRKDAAATAYRQALAAAPNRRRSVEGLKASMAP
jgi:tetratricopeptide (TPR) repeat protein